MNKIIIKSIEDFYNKEHNLIIEIQKINNIKIVNNKIEIDFNYNHDYEEKNKIEIFNMNEIIYLSISN